MNALLAIGAEIDPDEGRRRAAFSYLRKALEKPDIRAALSRRAGSDEEEVVWRERRFCVEVPGKGQCEGAFDRVVLTRDAGGRVTAAVIQDYKTDTVAADLLDERVAYYAPQLATYRRALAVMTGLAESAIGTELLFLSLGCVRTVGA
jgi:ATP-dependent exoDNAse (exonuclease V) beta subunit